MCELDKETFTCHRCKKQFKHTEGTWLPIGYDYSHQQTENVRIGDSIVRVMNDPSSPLWLREPEIVTDDKFTCYDCLEEGDGDGFLEDDYEDNAYHLDATKKAK